MQKPESKTTPGLDKGAPDNSTYYDVYEDGKVIERKPVTTPIGDYMNLMYSQMMTGDPPDHVVLLEDIYIDNVLPKSGAGMWLKAGTYINGVRQDD